VFPAKRTSLILFLLAAVGCLGCDQVTKDIARAYLAGAAPSPLFFGTIELLLTENAGAFLGFGSAMPEIVRQALFMVGAPAMLLLLSTAFLWRSNGSTLETLAWACVVGGGAGNWLDRILRDGVVTDFVRIGIGPLQTGIFNIADVSIMGGVTLIVWCQWRSFRAEPV